MIPRRADGYKVGSSKRQRVDMDAYVDGTYGGNGGYCGDHSGSHYYGQSVQVSFPAVRLRGLPFNCREADVLEFFAGLDIIDIVFVKNQGRFSGDAFVVFGIYWQVEMALQRDRQNMGRRYVEVFRCKKQDYYQAVAAEVNPESEKPNGRHHNREGLDEKKNTEHSGVLRLRGLRFSATKRDITEFFGDYALCEDNVHIVRNSEGRATGEAFVEFGSAEDSKAAMSKDRMMIGNRYVELFPSTQEEAAIAASKSGR